MNNFKYLAQRQDQKPRWGHSTGLEQQSQTSLLTKKDLQIKRLQSQLQMERKRADNALKMLQSFRTSHKIQQQSATNAKSQIGRRLHAEEQARRLKNQNEKLKALLKELVGQVENFGQDFQNKNE